MIGILTGSDSKRVFKFEKIRKSLEIPVIGIFM